MLPGDHDQPPLDLAGHWDSFGPSGPIVIAHQGEIASMSIETTVLLGCPLGESRVHCDAANADTPEGMLRRSGMFLFPHPPLLDVERQGIAIEISQQFVDHGELPTTMTRGPSASVLIRAIGRCA
jgi:hypothetical protein